MMPCDLYDLTKYHLNHSVNPWQAYCRARLMMTAFLMEKVEQPVQWRWKS